MKTYVELPTAHYFLGVKVGATHWAAHYVILQSEPAQGRHGSHGQIL